MSKTMAAAQPTQPASLTASRVRGSGRKALVWPATVALAFTAGVAAMFGWNNFTAGQLQPGSYLSGTVSVVNHDGSAICLLPDGGGHQFCSTPFLQAGASPLAVGQHVTGRVAQIDNGEYSGEVFVVTTPGPK
jgi:hypothetical protein